MAKKWKKVSVKSRPGKMPLINCGGKGGKPGPCPKGGKGEQPSGGKAHGGDLTKMSDSDLISQLKVVTKQHNKNMDAWFRAKGPEKDKLKKEAAPLMELQGRLNKERIRRQLTVTGKRSKTRIVDPGEAFGF